MSNTKKLAISGILSALAVVVMMLGGLIPAATFCCPAIAGVILIPVFVECGEKSAWAAWFVSAVLAMILSPDKESALLFLFIGYYPVLRWRLEQIRNRVFRIIAKLAVFNIAVIVMYVLSIFVFKLEAVLNDYRELGIILSLVTLIIGNAVLLLYDRLVNTMTKVYVYKFRSKLIK